MNEARLPFKVKYAPRECAECEGSGRVKSCLHLADPYCVCPERICRKCGGGGGVACIECGDFTAVEGLHDVFCLSCEEQYQTAERWRAMQSARDDLARQVKLLEAHLGNLPESHADRSHYLSCVMKAAVRELRDTHAKLEVLQ